MKSRLVVLTMLVLGMLLSTAGAGLAVSGISGNAAADQYATTPVAHRRRRRPRRPGLRHRRAARRRAAAASARPAARRAPTCSPRVRSRRAPTTTKLPFTGFAAIPVLLGGIALLSAGLVLRRRTGDER